MSLLNQRSLPTRIQELSDLASDLWWSWHPPAREVFRTLDYVIWRETSHNPVQMLALISEERLHDAARDPAFLELYDKAMGALRLARIGGGTWWSQHYGNRLNDSVAYFSAEFAVHQSVPLYAGGLGVLAGDYCKEAGDLGVPLIGVGFRYSMGYFRQRISAEGWQMEDYVRFPIGETPLERAQTPQGAPCTITVPLADRAVQAAVWALKLGRVRLYLLDTDVEGNSPWDRELSARLYVSEHEARLQQEIILGIGGVRALRALGHSPKVWHLNEGHAAFVVLERIRENLQAGESFATSLDKVRETTVFTTHTPVPAGHDAFPFQMVEGYLSGLGVGYVDRPEPLLVLGAYDSGAGTQFNMTALACRASNAVNAVSLVHRDVTHKMFAPIWTDTQRPVRGITNGVHVSTWIAPSLDALFAGYLGSDWKSRQDDPHLWDAVLEIPDIELWNVRLLLKSYLLAFIREHARHRWTMEKATAAQIAASGTLLDPSALTIGFARRFAEYKRSELIFRDPERLIRLLGASRQPVQFIFAGKAHPADDPGKRSLQRIYHRASDPRFAGRVAFVDDYDLHVAHFFVQGCDLWLNNPRKPLEACGTSGMKASINGVPQLSVADGWWAEGYNGANGWLIEQSESGDEQAEADSLYRLLEEQIIPTFYERNQQGVPVRWMAVVKEAIRSVTPQFCARRMVKEYVQKMYVPLRGKGADARDQLLDTAE